ncbi:hypothetical protein [Chroococcidiopsis sp. CCMEE 29]|uniref:hypothetical protein n=1 Tax=Chroococcidiopsis sp. CCMEE 29 TaxID=155894 RepID=UPI002021D138|nr:hypothetical protein [Chroococcidiopsis sp. CCMEE 29]
MRCKVRDQASTETHGQANSLSSNLTQSRQWVAQKIRMVTVGVLLALGLGLGFTREASPQIAQAETTRVELSLDRQPNETYESLLSRAEATAQTAVQESFDQNSALTDVSIVVTAQHQGAIAPVLSLEVSRPEWVSNPNIQRWSTHFTAARSLLRFDPDLATSTPDNQPQTASPTPPRQPQNTTPSSGRERINNRDSTFTQPGSVLSPLTPGPTNNIPSQPGTANPATTPSDQTPAPGTDLSPQPPVIEPVAPPENLQSPTSPNNLSPSGTSTPVNTPQNPLMPPTNGSTPSNQPGNLNNTPNQNVVPNDDPLENP